jgi:TonB family protein
MRTHHRRRFILAVLFSLLCHVTAFVVFLPLLAAWQATKTLFQEENEALKVALLMALLLHVAVVLPVTHFLLSMKDDGARTEVARIDLWEHEPVPDKEEEEKTPEQELEDYEPEEKLPEDGQVVQVPPSEDRRPPDKETRFLSEQDSRVEEETVSRLRLPGVAEAAPSPELAGKGKDAQTEPGGMRMENVVVGPPPPPEMEEADQGDEPKPETAPLSLEDINLNPSLEAMTSALAGTGLDHLEGVIEGDSTAVNTMGWKFASFFNRVKQQVERYWHPDREYRERDPYGNIYGLKDRRTVLLVILRSDGSLKKVYVMEPSGAPFLDDEAREAVEQGAPFPNVPLGLRDKRDGLVKFTFHFLVEVGSRPVFRMRRY